MQRPAPCPCPCPRPGHALSLLGKTFRGQRGDPSPSSPRGPPQSTPPLVPFTPPPLWPRGLQGAGSEDPRAPHALPVGGLSFWRTAWNLAGPPLRRWAWLRGLTPWPGKLRGQLPHRSGSLRAARTVRGAQQAHGPAGAGWWHGLPLPPGPLSPGTAVRGSSMLVSRLPPQAGPRPGREAPGPCPPGCPEETVPFWEALGRAWTGEAAGVSPLGCLRVRSPTRGTVSAFRGGELATAGRDTWPFSTSESSAFLGTVGAQVSQKGAPSHTSASGGAWGSSRVPGMRRLSGQRAPGTPLCRRGSFPRSSHSVQGHGRLTPTRTPAR